MNRLAFHGFISQRLILFLPLLHPQQKKQQINGADQPLDKAISHPLSPAGSGELLALQEVEERAGREYEEARELRRAEAEGEERATKARERADMELEVTLKGASSCVTDLVCHAQAAKKAAKAVEDGNDGAASPKRCPICTLMPPCKHTEEEGLDAPYGLDDDDKQVSMSHRSKLSTI